MLNLNPSDVFLFMHELFSPWYGTSEVVGGGNGMWMYWIGSHKHPTGMKTGLREINEL